MIHFLSSNRQFIQLTEHTYKVDILKCVKGKWGVVTAVVGWVGWGSGSGVGDRMVSMVKAQVINYIFL